MDDEADGILNIALSDSDSEQPTAKSTRRTDQTEAEFQAVKASYSVKIENGNIAETLNLPLGPDANKPHVQEALHAVEELYFFQRFDDGINLVDRLLANNDTAQSSFNEVTRELLTSYRSKCETKRDQASRKEHSG